MGWREKEAAKLSGKRVLVVGAGGVGCELLKNIALTGFNDIHVVTFGGCQDVDLLANFQIDMDTIDVSNLNRQFLFRREHVGKAKAEVATGAIRQLRPNIKISFDLDSIFSSKFDLPFFQQFSLVMNALDNRGLRIKDFIALYSCISAQPFLSAARNHVNRMCLAAKVPLIESGSSGYLGQVRPIIRERTECYECMPKPPQEKTYPGCTIRNTPSEHIHCTVWAKHAFNQLFGELDIDDDISPDLTDEGNRGDDGNSEKAPGEGDARESQDDAVNGLASTNGSHEMETDSDAKQKISTRAWAESVNYDPEKIFDKLFFVDINYLLQMEHLWRERRAPAPIRRADAVSASASSSRAASGNTSDVNVVWSLSDCADVFCESVAALSRRKSADNSSLHWDKDDEDAMRFVAACANIRATIFWIPCKSLFEIKSMAGNIIPAIATTNAIVAGMVVVEAAKIISGDFDKLRVVFINRAPNPRGKILVDQVPFQPNPKCFVCSDKRVCFIRLNLSQMTVKAFEDKVLKGALNMVEPDVLEVTTSRIIISSEEGETADLDQKFLSELSIGNAPILMCDDFHQKLELQIVVQNCEKLKGDEFEVLQDSGGEKDADEESRKRKSMASPDVAEEELAAKRVKL
ncbi:unnamed protein product [Heligmosomoides polygyrus]|uniref:SUMO-activating enzyme subunit n=1 Tax=Heligmosomoides polygyrus TaxID=6339 RepID=A0A183GNK9_HELPZ|nr:unnamed protein product [Heligmosomoides polygyrus]